MSPDELQEILRLHSMWLSGEDGGARADLRGAKFSMADLREANLSGANLGRANLSGADLSGADLRGADVSEADLREANLRVADISGANLGRANLSGADLSGADLRGADVSEADLREANFRVAYISGANFNGAIDGSVCRMDFGGWSICVRASHTTIGCRQYANQFWLEWSPDDVAFMHADARDWWTAHGEAIKAVIRCVMSKAAKEKETT